MLLFVGRESSRRRIVVVVEMMVVVDVVIVTVNVEMFQTVAGLDVVFVVDVVVYGSETGGRLNF